MLAVGGVILLTILAGVASAGQNFAVVVAGSNTYMNYRHQADICHAYQILHKHGIPDSNIVVFMYDDIAHNTENPTPGIIVNHINGQDVYKGVPKDYTGANVTPTNFLNVLLGNKAAMQGIGSGKVLESGPDDNVFIFYSDHGATGLVAFPTGVLYAKDLNKTIGQMYTEKKYKEMTIYIEACESGSMLDGLLPANINVYGTTASNPTESSYACYYDPKRQTYVGDLYSVNWMEDSDAEDIAKETLFTQFTITKQKTNLSHVMQYGDLSMGTKDNVGQFQGSNMIGKPLRRNPLAEKINAILKRDAVPMEEVRTTVLARRLASLPEGSPQQVLVQNELESAFQQRNLISVTINAIAKQAVGDDNSHQFELVTTQRLKHTQYDCYMTATQRIQEKCFDLFNEYVLNKLWIVSNLCEVGLQATTINNAVDTVCNALGRQNF